MWGYVRLIEWPIWQSINRMIDPSIDRTIDWEDLIICIAIWTLYKLWDPLVSDELRVRPIASLNKLRFTLLWGSIFKDFGRFGDANLEGKIDFWGFFSMFFSRSMLASIFHRFSEARNVKNSNFASTGARFSQNWRFQNIIEKPLIFEPFLDAKTMKIR